MILTYIDTRALKAKLEQDFPISLRPYATDMGVVREMVARGLDRRDLKRPEKDRRKNAD